MTTAMGSALKIRRVALPKGEWTAVQPPTAWRTAWLSNVSGQDLLMRSDPDDPLTQDVFAAFAQQEISSIPAVDVWDGRSSKAVLIYLQPSQQVDGTVVIRYI